MPNGINNTNLESSQSYKNALKDIEQLTAKIQHLEKAISSLSDKQRHLTKSTKESGDQFEKFTKKVSKSEEAVKNNNEEIEKGLKTSQQNQASLKKSIDLLETMKDKYDDLTQSEKENLDVTTKLHKSNADLSEAIKGQQTQVEESSEAFDFHEKTLQALGNSFETLKNSSGEYAPVLDSVANGFNGMRNGLAVVSTGFKGVGMAWKATGFGLLMLVLESLTEYFTHDKLGFKRFQGMLAAVGLVIGRVKGLFQKLGGEIVNALIHPGDTIEKLWKGLVQNIANRFKALGVIMQGVLHMDAKKITDGVVQLTTGVTNATDKITAGVTQLKNGIEETYDAAKKAYKAGHEKAELGKKPPEEPKATVTNIAAESTLILNEYNKNIETTNAYYEKLKASKKLSSKQRQDIEKQHQEALQKLVHEFQTDDLDKLTKFQDQLQQIVIESTEDAKQKAILQAQDDKKKKLQEFDNNSAEIKRKVEDEEKQLAALRRSGTKEQQDILEESIRKQKETLEEASKIRIQYETQLDKRITEAKEPESRKAEKESSKTDGTAPEKKNASSSDGEDGPVDSIKNQLKKLKEERDIKIADKNLSEKQIFDIEKKYAKEKLDLEAKLQSAKIHAGDKYIDAVLKNAKKDSAIYKAAFLAKKATAVADVIISRKKGIMGSFQGYSGFPFIGQALAIAQAAFIAAQGASSIAEIVKQKPGMAQGGYFKSDGRGAVLPGYSRTDNTNAYLRSGEAVVVSEAMRNPWARNLVSAINVAHGGRDFSVPNTGRGYAVGGIFTDCGNANRYYSQPMNDTKDLANSLAYQMINNFPPIYVDVKDVNNQQSILAQTINRVNL